MNIARRGRLFAQRKKRRLMEKSGSCNFNLIGLERRRFKYLSDWFTTFLELQWRYIILSCLMAFCFTWFFFGLLWWGIFAAKKDTECIIGVNSFVTALLFSIETQHTIGYGTRAITDACASGIILIMLQSTVGVIIQCIATGIIFAKLARPKLRAATVIFSKQAVVCQQDGDLCLMFRVGNMRTSQMMDIKINAFLVKSKLTKEGELISFYQEHLSVTTEAEDEFYFLAWPIKAKHKITENSPLYSLSPEDLLKAEFEIIIVLEAICEATGGSIQVRTSYLPGEILWGHKLAALFPRHTTGRVKNWKYTIDFTKFNDTLPVNIPDFSARELNKRRGSKVSKIRFESECETFSNNEVYLTSSSEPKKIV
ncbi:hypothetical protein CAPTEDRAFT_90880 [Capitella teleta]|uniref:Inward rectifier potassium channel C-terminal domain-containing protein n=1 Tax=Capitella teleta TaxID=283909 RepID=R7TJH0_CAPTE|nr:hypothetical protein CAPTEDRAFT_90880 [Capitella teleta]|eukprot:ELT91696.1 hypothetical protein CAPTEDRAFT_90880 [Capitella teleta]